MPDRVEIRAGVVDVWSIAKSTKNDIIVDRDDDNVVDVKSTIVDWKESHFRALAHNGGRGVKGGLSEYARMLGKAQQHVSLYKQAAEVLNAIKNLHIDVYVFLDKAQNLEVNYEVYASAKAFSQENSLLDKAKHLAAIHNFYSQIILIIGIKTADTQPTRPESALDSGPPVDKWPKTVDKLLITLWITCKS